jgi:hypothetical protein
MSDKTREPQSDDRRLEDEQARGEAYESPRVEDIPLDRPATTQPGLVAVVGGSPDATD